MAETGYEEACRCFKCGNPGEVAKKESAPVRANLPQGTQIHTVYCRRELCPWFNTCWMVQVNADGSVPPPRNHTGEQKIYSDDFLTHDQDAQDIVDDLRKQAELQKVREGADPKGAQEIRRRF